MSRLNHVSFPFGDGSGVIDERQMLNVMRIIHEYLCLVEDQIEPTVPRTYVFAGKAAKAVSPAAPTYAVPLIW